VKLSRSNVLTAGVGALVLTAAAAGVASASTPEPSAPLHIAPAAATTPAAPITEERCEALLPGQVLGSPDLTAGSRSGARIWHDGTGWHLRVTHPGSGTEVFTGTVRSGQPISAHGYKLEPQDGFYLSNGNRTLSFRFVNHGGIDGIDFTDRCAIDTAFSVQRSGHELSPIAVYLGKHGAHPTSNPFLIERHH
jgi:hypothetical protein